MATIKNLQGFEILDSRGRPTVLAQCELDDGTQATASVPSGASTGAAEAWELRDGDVSRYGGMGCKQAVGHISGKIADSLLGKDFESQQQLDQSLLDLDASDNKSNLGANAILAVSLVFARACAMQAGVPLYAHFASMAGLQAVSGANKSPSPPVGQASRLSSAGMADPPCQVSVYSQHALPRLTINLFSGGKHAGGSVGGSGGQVAIQDVLLVPVGATTIDQGLADVYAVYQAAAKITLEKFGSRALTADEGGLAPPFTNVDQMLETAVQAIDQAGFEPGKEMALAVDVAASHFYEGGQYHFSEKLILGSAQMIDLVSQWVNTYPIVSVEDALGEDDWDHWPTLCKTLGDTALTLGDDLLCTNPVRIKKAVATQAANALLLKVNQIGCLTEAANALKLARQAGWRVTIRARSGETEDNWLADLAVGWRPN